MVDVEVKEVDNLGEGEEFHSDGEFLMVESPEFSFLVKYEVHWVPHAVINEEQSMMGAS